MKVVPFRLIATAVICVLACTPAWAAKRVALLIGNSSYSATTPLKNPASDVTLMRDALTKAGFDSVDVVLDAGRLDMLKALRSFEGKVQGADIAMVYYSGHGIEIGGENYLIPTDATLASDKYVPDETVPISRVEETMDGAGRLKLIVLDACRNNPFLAGMKKTKATRSVGRGLARVQPEVPDTLVAYAAAAGDVAQDGDGTNSPFAEALAARLFQPGVDVRIALGNVRDDVLKKTGREQTPFFEGSIGGGIVELGGPAAAPAASAPSVAPSGETVSPRMVEAGQIWDTLKDTTDIPTLTGFRDQYSDTFYATLADSRIRQLQAAATLTDAKQKVAKLSPQAGAPQAGTAGGGESECNRRAARTVTLELRTPGLELPKADLSRVAAACSQEADRSGSIDLAFLAGRALYLAKRGDEALPWLEKAAAAGHGEAMNTIGHLYQTGNGVKQDFAVARQWYERSLAAGDIEAMTSMGRRFAEGAGETKSYGDAKAWFEKAASSGSSDAMIRLSTLAFDAPGGLDVDAMRSWARKAAEAGNAFGMQAYAGDLRDDKKFDEALPWYRKSYDAGNRQAAFFLARFYREGLGTSRDTAEAAKWAALIPEN